MRIQTYLMVSLGIFTGACSSVSNSSINPMTWVGSKETVETLAPDDGYVVSSDSRGLVSQVTDLTVVNANGGVIVHATGLPPTQGYFNAELFPLNDEKPDGNALVYEFRILGPLEQRRASSEASRRVIVAHFISNEKLRTIGEIRVLGAQNSRSSRAQ